MIYFIRAVHSGAIKIGVSNDPKRRLETMRVGSPEPLEMISVMPGQFEEERRLHAKFARFRMHGEWFKGDEELLQGIAILLQAPIDELIENVYAKYWVVRGDAANGSSGGYTELFCVCRDGGLIPDPQAMIAALPCHYEFYGIDSIDAVTQDHADWPADPEVLRKPLSSSTSSTWVAYLDDWRFFPVLDESNS